jgi:hypothetical protein
MLGVPVDLGRLYGDPDPIYMLWVEMINRRVHATNERQRREQEKRKGRSSG